MKSKRPDQKEADRKPSFALGDQDLHLFNEGTHARLYGKLGAHPIDNGVHFAVWAPGAKEVSVTGDFNYWSANASPLSPRENSGIWEGFIPGVSKGALYKYAISAATFQGEKADPFAFWSETPPKTASVVWDLKYEWADEQWMSNQKKANALNAPISIYEMHLGSWRRNDHGDYLGYRALAPPLCEYLTDSGFTHVEFLPVMEHPFYGSWGYQTTGYFSPTSRYGTPQDLMFLIDQLHQNGIGVILDWVPSHFATDAHGLGNFDGTHLYEHADPRLGHHPDWGSYIFNYGRHEVKSFLLSSAMFWLDKYHADGLRVDAVASMLYLDYSRKEGEWIPNRLGGRENLDAIDFLRTMNEQAYLNHPGTQTYAEESTSWPMVSRPTDSGGLGFGFKWDMGWMNDTLSYMRKDPVHRRFHQNELTFRAIYAFHENFVLPLSHDEVVHGKASLLNQMPGDEWQRLANLRILFAYMYALPGKKLLFMGQEFAQSHEWNHEDQLAWDLLETDGHAGLQRLVQRLNSIYRSESALHEIETETVTFDWLDASDVDQSVLSFIRLARDGAQLIVAAFNFTPVPRLDYRVGVPASGQWKQLVSTDAKEFGGSGVVNPEEIAAEESPAHGREWSLNLTLPPLGAVLMKSGGRD